MAREVDTLKRLAATGVKGTYRVVDDDAVKRRTGERDTLISPGQSLAVLARERALVPIGRIATVKVRSLASAAACTRSAHMAFMLKTTQAQDGRLAGVYVGFARTTTEMAALQDLLEVMHGELVCEVVRVDEQRLKAMEESMLTLAKVLDRLDRGKPIRTVLEGDTLRAPMTFDDEVEA